MDRIGVLGDIESIKGFACLGLDIFPCEGKSVGEKAFKELLSKDYGVIYITEQLAALLYKEIAKTDKKFKPSIVAIPDIANGKGFGREALRQAVIKAVGSDIIFDKE